MGFIPLGMLRIVTCAEHPRVIFPLGENAVPVLECFNLHNYFFFFLMV